MKKIVSDILALGIVAGASTAFAAEGEYHPGLNSDAAKIDRTHTGSIKSGNTVRLRTSRDNRLPFDDDHGSYYEGAQRPR